MEAEEAVSAVAEAVGGEVASVDLEEEGMSSLLFHDMGLVWPVLLSRPIDSFAIVMACASVHVWTWY